MTASLAHIAIVAAGGALGAAGRHMMNLAALRLMGPGFPWGTLTVNVVGSLLMGVLIGVLAKWTPAAGGEFMRLFLGVGLLGGFTTFSAFSLDVVAMWERGEVAAMAVYVLGSVSLSIAAVFAGIVIMRWLAP